MTAAKTIRLESSPRTHLLRWLAFWLLLAGCDGPRGDQSAVEPGSATELEETEPANDDAGSAGPSATAEATREVWDAIYFSGKKVGYAHTVYLPSEADGRKVTRIEQLMHLELRRFQQQSSQDVKLVSIEDPKRGMLEFQSEASLGPAPTVTRGKVEGDELILESSTEGKTSTSSIPWKSGAGGIFATEQTLLDKPLQPGEQRTMRALQPIFNQVAQVEFVADDYERTDVLGAELELLKIDVTISLPEGAKFVSTVWTDRTGESVKTVAREPLPQETYRTTREVALGQIEAASFDVGLDTIVTLDRPIPQAHESTELRYRIRLDGGDPADVFPQGPTQSVRSLDEHTIELTVRAVRPSAKDGANKNDGAEASDDDLQPNNLIQSDDPQVMKLAQEAVGRETDPWKSAVAIESFVRRAVRNKNFSTAFATAAEVARTREGDCTEHAVLLAGLARARGIPARVAIGLVYVDSAQGFAYHMWDEVFVRGQWIPLDGTLAKGGIGAAHLKLAHSTLKGASAYTSLLPVAQVLGRLQIEIVDP